MLLRSATACVALISLWLPSSIALGATDGNVGGVFEVGDPPVVHYVQLQETAITPQVEYAVVVRVTTTPRLSNLSTIVLKLWYDADGGSPALNEFLAATAHPQTCAVITFTVTGTQGDDITWQVALAPSGSTWVLGTTTVSNTKKQYSQPVNFTFRFKPGKVATQTTGSARWQVAAQATNRQNQSGWNWDAEGTAMNWYGEIIVPSMTVDWGKIRPGTDFTSPWARRQLSQAITYIANGDYARVVRAPASWTGGGFAATYDNTGQTASPQYFALKADDAADLGSAVLVTTGGARIGGGSQTTESGVSVGTMYLWIRLADSFLPASYSGTITYVISNQ